MLKPDRKFLQSALWFVLLTACNSTTSDIESDDRDRHLIAPDVVPTADIPDIVSSLPVVTLPQAEPTLELYSVVVQDVPVREILFAMARDANLNIDVHSGVTGSISINAIDQTLPQILDRITRLVDIRWSFERADYLLIEPDLPELRSYNIDYVNIERSAQSEVSLSSAVTGGIDPAAATSGNNSTTLLTQTSSNTFWATLEANLTQILSVADGAAGSAIIVSPESGLVTVRATGRQHDEIFTFIESVRTRASYQVLIEATVVEVSLNDRFQMGVDWAMLGRNGGEISFTQQLTGLNLNTAPTNVLTIDQSSGPDAINATIRLLAQFGKTQVLSSPKLMALNNQTAMLRVVDSKIYFTIEVEAGIAASPAGPGIPPTFTSEVHTVPVGFTMAVTPQISENDQVTLNVRPTITRIIGFVNDPNPVLAEADVVNAIPEIQIREIESILKVDSGQIAILGGLMQDSVESDVSALPGFNRLPFIGDLFKYRDESTIKTELIIFIRPTVIRQPSINGDFQNYRNYLPTSTTGQFAPQSSLLAN